MADPFVAALTYEFSSASLSYRILKSGSATIIVGGNNLVGTAFTPHAQSGVYRFGVPTKKPFTVLFHGNPKFKPEMQSLAGKPSTQNQVHVCLLTIAQHHAMSGGDQVLEEFQIERQLVVSIINRAISAAEESESDDRSERLANLQRVLAEVQEAYEIP
ncbi:MAG: hypothetical protein SynsKO_34620 [Synoicihabitans sp.]